MTDQYDRDINKTLLAMGGSGLLILVGIIGIAVACFEFVEPSTPGRDDELFFLVLGVVLIAVGVISMRVASRLNRRYQEALSKELERIEERKFQETKQWHAEVRERNIQRLANLDAWVKKTAVTSFRVAPGSGQDAGCTVITVEWETDPQNRARLWLYKHRGDILTSAEEVLSASGVRRLDSKVRGETLRYVDPDASPSVVDNYYIWMDATVAAQAVSGAWFNHIAHRHSKKEDFVSFVDRKVSQHEAAERLKALKPKPPQAEKPKPTPKERVLQVVEELHREQKTLKEVQETLEAEIDKLNLSDIEKQILMSEALQRLGL